MEKAIFIGFNALGDTLCTTPVIHEFRKQNPEVHITYIVQNAEFTRILEGNPDIDFLMFNQQMYIHGMTKYSDEWIHSLPLNIKGPTKLYHFDINQVCVTEEVFYHHIASGFAGLLNIPIKSVRPKVVLTKTERALAASFVDNKPYAVISRHSVSNPLRKDGNGKAKDWPLENWEKLCQHLMSTGIETIISIGSEVDQQTPSAHWKNLYGLPIRVVAALLENAACVVTLENGIGHLCHAVDAPTVVIYSDIVPLGWANPVECTNYQVLYNDPHKTSCEEVIQATSQVLKLQVESMI